MERTNAELRAALESMRRKEEKWNQEKEMMLKTMNMMQQELRKYKKKYHKRASSQQPTFIFNQTNISSYYPIVMLKNTPHTLKHTLRSHLDSVRAITPAQQFLLTAGEDCTLKLWHKDTLRHTIRRHLGPVYALSSHQEQVWTGGAEGVVRQWSLDRLVQDQAPIFELDLHEQPIWDLAFNIKHSLLLTSSADQSHKLLRVTPQGLKVLWRSTLQDIPTAVHWATDSRFISGFCNRQQLGVFDSEKGCQSWSYGWESSGVCSQANRVLANRQMIVAGHQDNNIRFFDPNSNRKIKEIVGHSEGVTSISLRGQAQELISCGHDGNLRFWDLRKYKCVSDVSVHMKKYDEGALCMAQWDRWLAVGGADGTVKLLQQQH